VNPAASVRAMARGRRRTGDRGRGDSSRGSEGLHADRDPADARRHAARLASVQSVGLTSIVISRGAPNRPRIGSIAAAMQSGRRSDGVPPPR
jgi:hypothetical protein